jgi:hypothetical protein
MEERKKKPPFEKQPAPKQVSVNPSVHGVQPKNTPDGRDAPAQGDTRAS